MSFHDFNTSTLGYKLISGKLRETRKQSEQLNKYVAGLIDSDGSVCLHFSKNKYINIRLKISQTFISDLDADLLRSLRDFYNKGKLYYTQGEKAEKSIVAEWLLINDEVLYILPHLIKHLRIKATHLDNLAFLYKELRSVSLSPEAVLELKEFSQCSRQNSRWLKKPKHPSFAWVAGFLDGDGCYFYRERYKSFKSEQKRSTSLKVKVTGHLEDTFCLEWLKESFKGHVYFYKEAKSSFWVRNLGKSDSVFALDFLKQMRKYSCISRKYIRICEMISYHENLKQQRLNKEDSKE